MDLLPCKRKILQNNLIPFFPNMPQESLDKIGSSGDSRRLKRLAVSATRVTEHSYWLFWLLLPGKNSSADVFKLSAISLVFTAFFLFVSEYTFPGGSYQFTDYARTLFHGVTRPDLYIRDIGYPLLLLLTGYTLTYSFIGVTLLQAAMAWAIPLLVYGSVARVSRWAAFYAAVATILSLSPFIYMKFMHHDLPYIFFSMLTLYLAIVFLSSGRRGYLYLAIASLIAVSLIRPGGNALAAPLLLVVLVLKPSKWRHYLLCALVVAICALAYAAHRVSLLGETPQGHVPSYFGHQIFYNLYVNSADYGVRVEPSLGPATAHLFARAREQIKDGSLDSKALDEWYHAHNFPEPTKERWFTGFNGRPEAFIETLIQEPSHDYFEFFSFAEQDDRVFLDASLEIVKHYPIYPLRYTRRNLFLLLWSPGVAHGRYGGRSFAEEKIYFLPFTGSFAVEQVKAYVPPPGRDELLAPNSRLARSIIEWLDPTIDQWKRYYRDGNQVVFMLAAVALIGALFGQGALRAAACIAWLFLLYNATVTAAFAEPNYRYHFFLVPILLVCAGLGVAIIFGCVMWTARMLVRYLPLPGDLVNWLRPPVQFVVTGVTAFRNVPESLVNYRLLATLLAVAAVIAAVAWSTLLWSVAHA